MSNVLRCLRRAVLAPSLAEVTFERRGFPVVESPDTLRLEAIPRAVVCGFEWGMESAGLREVESRLALVDVEQRGFAYEGAVMAFTVLDAMARGHRTRDLLRASGRPHIFLAYIGIGFAMARLPRRLWSRVLPELDSSPYHPTMSWLAVDGYGFDRAYFDTPRWVERQYRPRPYPWLGRAGYFPRAVDQGIGRALWFVHGARVSDVAAAVRRFATDRQADLWSGVGLAATFAGGGDLPALRREAGEHRAEAALGAVFAAKARHVAGYVPPHTEAALAVLAGLPVDAASALADDTAVHEGGDDRMPPYELWRARIRATLGNRATTEKETAI